MKDRPATVARPPARRVPRRLAVLALLASLLAMAAAAVPAAAVAASAGQLYAFGYNFYGELGNTTNNGTEEANPTPALVTLSGAGGSVTAVAAGGSHSLAATSTGQLYGFGYNYYGELGNATNSGTTEPLATPTPATLPGATGPVIAVTAGGYHSLALTSTGQLYAFGRNYYGELGIATNSHTNTPNPTPTLVTLPGATGPVTEIAAGGAHGLALTSTGQLYAFGENRYGQLGSETNSGTGEPNPTPTLVTLPGATGPVTKIAAGDSHSLALTSTGQLYAFGDNRYGELGSETNNGTNNANPTPSLVTLPGASGAVTGVAAGIWYSLAVTSSGQLFAFGINNYGQLGSETNSGTNNANPTPTLVDLGAGATVDAVAAGSTAEQSLVVIANLAVSTDSLPAGTVGAPYGATATATGGTAPYTWQASGLPAGLSIDSASGKISGTPSAAGSSQVTLTVSDRYGILASSGPLALTVADAPSEEGVPSATKPKLTKLSQSRRRWRLGSKLAKTSALAPRRASAKVGTTFRFRLNVKAKVKLVFEIAKGKGFKKAGVLSFAGKKGANKVTFQGRLSSHKTLRPGDYELVAFAQDGSQRSKARTLRFTIVG